MQVSQLYFDLRIHFECSGDLSNFLTAYKDIAGVWTIGIGTTHYPDGTAVKQGDTCTSAEAVQYAQHDTDSRVKQVAGTLPTGLTAGQIDAIIDFCYNAGVGAWNTSTLRQRITAAPSDYNGITEAFLMWNKAHVGGELKEVPGLTRRRKSEAYLYEHGANHPTFFE